MLRLMLKSLTLILTVFGFFIDSLESDILDWYHQADAAPTLSGSHLAAYTVAPGRDGTGGTEVANANAYARLAFARNGTNWGAASEADPSESLNATAATFTRASGGSWGTVVALAYVTSGTYGAGVVEEVFPLDTSKDIDDGDLLEAIIGELKSRFGEPTDTYS